MNLPKKDADLFYKLMWGLQFFVNQQLKIRPEIDSLEDYIALPSQEKIDIRDRLWAEASIIIGAWSDCAEKPSAEAQERLEAHG